MLPSFLLTCGFRLQRRTAAVSQLLRQLPASRGIWGLEREAATRTKKAVSMQEMLERTPKVKLFHLRVIHTNLPRLRLEVCDVTCKAPWTTAFLFPCSHPLASTA
jgi:hypothetical protein